MALVGFEQDTAAPPGTGTFRFDDGRQLYARDPEMADSLKKPKLEQPSPELMAAAQRGPDQRVAGPGGAPQSDEDRVKSALGVGQAGPPARSQGLPPGPTGGGPPEQASFSTPPSGQAPAPQGQGLQNDISGYVNRPIVSGPTRGGLVPAKGSTTVEQEGLPYDPELARQRSDARIDVQLAHQNTVEAQAARSQAEALHYQTQLPELQKQAAQAQTEMAAQQDHYKTERADLDKMIAESNSNQKSFNANRWMESRGAIGQIGAVLAQAFGAYAATLSHGENWAKKIIDGYIDHDIETQRQQIESGKAGVSNALQKLQLRYGDMNQAQAALKIAMSRQVDAQVAAYAAAAKSEDAKLAGEEWRAQSEKDGTDTEQKFMAASFGKRKTEMSGAVVAPSRGGVRAPTEQEKQLRLKTVKEGQDVGAMPDTSRAGRALDIQEKAAEAKRKADPGIAKAHEQLNSIENSLRNAEELDKLYADPGILSRAQRGRMEYLQDISPLEVHKGLTGLSRFTETEGERYKTAYGEKGETLDMTGKHRAALGALREDLARKKKQLQQQIESGAGSPTGDSEDIKDVP